MVNSNSVLNSSNAHLLLRGIDPVVILENVKSCRSSIAGAIVFQEGLGIFAIHTIVITRKRTGYSGNYDDGG
jgi:hypothetical protein